MATSIFKYVVGWNPYEQAYASYHTKGNGEWFSEAEDVEEALKSIIPSVPYIGETTGRCQNLFFEGISLAGLRNEEVIQVWSNNPETIKRSDKYASSKKVGLRLGGQWGLECEISIYDVPNMLAKFSKKLALPGPSGDASQTSISPLGSELSNLLDPARAQSRALAITRTQIGMLSMKWEMEAKERQINQHMGYLREQSGIVQAYVAGVKGRCVIAKGDKAAQSDPYLVFPERLYLSEEIGLLMNLVDTDWRDVGQMYDWIGKEGRWKKLLPLPKCILVTRVRYERKDYGPKATFENIYWNEMNMEHVIWVRDGDYCAVLGCDLKLEDPILPPADHVQSTIRRLEEEVWNKHFNPNPKDDRYHGFNDYVPPKPGELKKNATKEQEPYTMIQDPGLKKYPLFESWLVSQDYTAEIRQVIVDKAQSMLMGENRERAPLLAYLQGIVDRGGYLNIPSGTNLMGLDSAKYIRLGNARMVLKDSRAAKVMESILNPNNLTKGDWIALADAPGGPKGWHLHQVRRISKNGVVLHYPSRRKRVRWLKDEMGRNTYEHSYYSAEPKPHTVDLKDDKLWMPWEKITREVIDLLLDDRDWKWEHRELTAFLGQWDLLHRKIPLEDGAVLKSKGEWE